MIYGLRLDRLTCRFVFVLDGELNVKCKGVGGTLALHADEYVYFPKGTTHSLTSDDGAGLLVFERRADMCKSKVRSSRQN